MENMNIFQKMSKITTELATISKNSNVDMGKGRTYKAVLEKDILDAVKPLEDKYGVYSYPVSREIVDNQILERETQSGTLNNFFLRIKTIYRFVNIDNKEDFIEMISFADGIDSGDKATGKAMTYADKYALMKAYKISTGDDNDKHPSPNEGYKKKVVIAKKDELPFGTDKDAQEIKTHEQLEHILDKLITDKNVKYDELCKAYKISELDIHKMTTPQLQHAIANIDKFKKNGE